MTCERCIEMISAAIDGELTDSEAADLDVHIAECPACRARSALMRRHNEAFRSAPIPNQPPALRAAIARRIGLSAIDRHRAVLHVHRIPDRPDFAIRTSHTEPAPGPIMSPWGRA